MKGAPPFVGGLSPGRKASRSRGKVQSYRNQRQPPANLLKSKEPERKRPPYLLPSPARSEVSLHQNRLQSWKAACARRLRWDSTSTVSSSLSAAGNVGGNPPVAWWLTSSVYREFGRPVPPRVLSALSESVMGSPHSPVVHWSRKECTATCCSVKGRTSSRMRCARRTL